MERQLTTCFFIYLCALTVCGPARAANPTFHADQEQFWNGGAAVIIAKVGGIQQSKGGPVGDYELNVQPQACVAGLFNPAANPTVIADYSLGLERRTIPKAGELVLAVLFDRNKLGVPRPGFGVANGRCSFMPDNQPLVVLTGMDDPVVKEVLRKIQAGRPATTAPATHPSGG